MSSPPIQHARTKIVATVGPACRKPEQLAALVAAGVDVFRLNMAHATIEEHGQTLADIRRVSQELKQPIGVLVDLAGPKIRLGELPGGMIDCHVGDEYRFVRGAEAKSPDELTTSYAPLVDELCAGDLLLLADGTVSMKVIDRQPDSVRARVVQPGMIRSRQGLNLPGVKLSAASMDDADREHAIWAARNEIDFVGLSFVRRPTDVSELKSLLREHGGKARVIAKIEKQEAVDSLDAILEVADALMVARGDLGVEIDVAQMPIVQKRIIASCHEHQKPVIIATQMLDSMQHSRLPTRAEVTDVANAILDGGDACMLSGETAIGQYPLESVAMMQRVALATEELFHDNVPQPPGNFRVDGLHAITAAVVYGASHVAAEIDARAIIVASHSGATALAISKQRNYVRAIGASDQPHVLRQMCLYWGIIPLAGIATGSHQEILKGATAWGRAGGVLSPGDHVVLVAGTGLGDKSHDQIVVSRVE